MREHAHPPSHTIRCTNGTLNSHLKTIKRFIHKPFSNMRWVTNDYDLWESDDNTVWRQVVTRCVYPFKQLLWPSAELLIPVTVTIYGCSVRFPFFLDDTANMKHIPAHIYNQNCLQNMANMSKPSLLFSWPAGTSRFIYLGVQPESEGIPHSFKIKLTRGEKPALFSSMGAEQVRPCVGAAATLSLRSLQPEPKHPGGSTLHISPL